jgi:hypothetical protein
MDQVAPEVRAPVLGNADTLMVFKCLRVSSRLNFVRRRPLSAITFVGISALKTLNENAAHMTAAAQRALTARAPDRMCWLSRTEFRSALDPRPENRSFTRKFEEKVKQFEVRIAELKKPRS